MFTVAEFSDVAASKADILQPDLVHAGGISWDLQLR
jgi:L-alanine-DL-glutamate epimerase-like enolase superfamily enzyme